MSRARVVLVTGASGFIGRHVLPCLVSRGYVVHATSRSPLDHQLDGVHWHCANLLRPDAPGALIASIRPTHLLHLAWTATPGLFWTAPENLDWVAASVTLYRAFVASGGVRAVFAGTCAEYNWSHDWLDEQTTPCEPASLYGVSKDALHRLLRHATANDGVSLAWGRVFSVHGPHEALPRLVPSVVVPLLRGQPAPCGEGVVERDFMHVEDLAEAFAMILDSPFQGPVNLASGECVPLRVIIGWLADQIGRPDLVQMGARPPRAPEPQRLAAAITTLRDEIGFTPRFGLRDGLDATVAWWRDHLASTQDTADNTPTGVGIAFEPSQRRLGGRGRSHG